MKSISAKSKHSIADIIEHYGGEVPTWARSDAWIKMRCPFHDDSHASAAINKTKNQFKCFGCGMGGDPYDIISEKEGLNFVAAIEFAERISPESGADIRPKRTLGSGVSKRKGPNLGRRGSVLGGSS